LSLYLRMPLRETAIGGATVAIRRCIEQGIPTFRPRLFRDQLLGRCPPAAMGSITVLSTAHIPAKSFRIRASTMALAKPNPRRGRWPTNVRPPAEGRACEVLHNLDRWWRRTDAENSFSSARLFRRCTSGLAKSFNHTSPRALQSLESGPTVASLSGVYSACRRHLGKSRFAPVRNVTRCGSRIAAFLWVGVDYLSR